MEKRQIENELAAACVLTEYNTILEVLIFVGSPLIENPISHYYRGIIDGILLLRTSVFLLK